MRTLIAYISYIGLMIAISLIANFAQAEDLCNSELKPFYESVKQYDNTEARRQQVLTQYHSLRNSVYSICDKNMIREFELAYGKVMPLEGKSHLETLSYYPRAPKAKDLGEY